MKHIAIVVEGQTEEAFVKNVVNPYLLPRDLFATPIIATTKTTPTGSHRGGAPWGRYVPLARNLAAQRDKAAVGIMLDYYGVPSDTPGFDATGSGCDYRERLLAGMAQELNNWRIRPHLVLHEFETLVLAAVDAGAEGSLTADERTALLRVIQEFDGNCEAINGGRDTSPSHRLIGACQRYVKTSTGISLLQEVSFDEVLERCPTFNGWFTDLILAAENHR